jgi:hypothetical protein
MNELGPIIESILDDLGVDAPSASLVTIGLADTDMPEVGAVDAYEVLSGPGDLPHALRAQLGIVVAPLDHMQQAKAEQLLSRLRDVHCERVVFIDTASAWSADVLRSLGYLELKRPPIGGRCYLYDPDLFNQPRDWNNPSDWANPENFGKYRW